MFLRSVVLALMLVPSLISGQQAVPPPPRPAEPPPAAAGPSLEATMQYLKEKIEGIGELHYCSGYIPYTSDGTVAACAQTTQSFMVAVDSTSCTLQFDSKNDELHWSFSDRLPLGDISKIELTSINALRGNDSVKADPDLPQLAIHFSKPSLHRHIAKVVMVPDTSQKVDKHHPQQMIQKVQEENSLLKGYGIVFDDADEAARVAKALTHASELCGGGNNELF